MGHIDRGRPGFIRERPGLQKHEQRDLDQNDERPIKQQCRQVVLIEYDRKQFRFQIVVPFPTLATEPVLHDGPGSEQGPVIDKADAERE